jgi:hypothetical protein
MWFGCCVQRSHLRSVPTSPIARLTLALPGEQEPLESARPRLLNGNRSACLALAELQHGVRMRRARAGSISNRRGTMNNLSVAAIALAVALGTGAYLSGPAAAQQQQHACDANADAFIDTGESRMCTARDFDELAAGEDVLSEERLSATGQGQEGRTFSEVDENADGEISRDEWTQWHEQRFTAAIGTGESGMPVADYDSMEWTKEGYVRPTPEAGGQNQQ